MASISHTSISGQIIRTLSPQFKHVLTLHHDTLLSIAHSHEYMKLITSLSSAITGICTPAAPATLAIHTGILALIHNSHELENDVQITSLPVFHEFSQEPNSNDDALSSTSSESETPFTSHFCPLISSTPHTALVLTEYDHVDLFVSPHTDKPLGSKRFSLSLDALLKILDCLRDLLHVSLSFTDEIVYSQQQLYSIHMDIISCFSGITQNELPHSVNFERRPMPSIHTWSSCRMFTNDLLFSLLVPKLHWPQFVKYAPHSLSHHCIHPLPLSWTYIYSKKCRTSTLPFSPRMSHLIRLEYQLVIPNFDYLEILPTFHSLAKIDHHLLTKTLPTELLFKVFSHAFGTDSPACSPVTDRPRHAQDELTLIPIQWNYNNGFSSSLFRAQLYIIIIESFNSPRTMRTHFSIQRDLPHQLIDIEPVINHPSHLNLHQVYPFRPTLPLSQQLESDSPSLFFDSIVENAIHTHPACPIHD